MRLLFSTEHVSDLSFTYGNRFNISGRRSYCPMFDGPQTAVFGGVI